METLLLLGLVLSLDSFRVSLGMGTLRLRAVRQAQIVIAFGVCDGLAPLLGMLGGRSLTRFAGTWAGYAGPALLACYGAFVVYSDWRCSDSEEGAEPGGWIVFGLPLSLSLDNLIAGASLGMLGQSPALSSAIIGGCSSLAALAGLQLGGMVRNRVSLTREWVGGLALIAIAAALAFDNLIG